MGTAPGAGGSFSGPNPLSTRHPSILPLRLEGGCVLHAAVDSGGDGDGAAAAPQRVLMDALNPGLHVSPRASPPNGLVLGVTSTGGPTSALDAVVGSVRPYYSSSPSLSALCLCAGAGVSRAEVKRR